jgi:hypothetical protein
MVSGVLRVKFALLDIVIVAAPSLTFVATASIRPSAGPTGAPEPQSTLQAHKYAFDRVGFMTTEMIELVACGHTIGGVQSKFFPTISTGTDDNPDGNAPLDSSSTLFDNHMHARAL